MAPNQALETQMAANAFKSSPGGLESQMVQIKAKWVLIQRWRPKRGPNQALEAHFCLLAHPSERSGVHTAFNQPLRAPKSALPRPAIKHLSPEPDFRYTNFFIFRYFYSLRMSPSERRKVRCQDLPLSNLAQNPILGTQSFLSSDMFIH